MELLVLNDLDHFIKEKLRIKYYIRYMDDFILISPYKNILQQDKGIIYRVLSDMGLQLNCKTEIQPLRHGIIFLKWHYYVVNSGRIIMLMARQKVTKYKHHLKKVFLKQCDAMSSLISYLANAKRGNTYKIRRYMRQFFYRLTGSELCERYV